MTKIKNQNKCFHGDKLLFIGLLISKILMVIKLLKQFSKDSTLINTIKGENHLYIMQFRKKNSNLLNFYFKMVLM